MLNQNLFQFPIEELGISRTQFDNTKGFFFVFGFLIFAFQFPTNTLRKFSCFSFATQTLGSHEKLSIKLQVLFFFFFQCYFKNIRPIFHAVCIFMISARPPVA